MEYVSGGELFEYLVNKGRLSESEALRFFQQIIVGLAFCHKRKICHRDLKPENLLLDKKRNVKIADFGMASLQKSGRLLETSCGSPHYASPEVVTGMKYDGPSSDIWSCGIILYALLTGHLPFDDENIRQLLSKVKSGKFYMPSDISPGARDLISRMLTVNPKRRITMQGVMLHPWFRTVNPEQNTLKEPAQDQGKGRPMLVEELDPEILRHMRWLFAPGPSHSNPEAKEVFDEEALLLEIQEKMTNSEENMEKLFYHLLCQHKTELLENYSGDESDIAPDAPRRRADSFPNSATCSIRSTTPEFGHAALSRRDSPIASPGSLLSPAVKGLEPTHLSLNPESTTISTHSSYMNEIKRRQSSSKLNGVISSKDIQSPYPRQESPDLENNRISSEETQVGNFLKKDDSETGYDVIMGESKPEKSNIMSEMAQLPPIHPMDMISGSNTVYSLMDDGTKKAFAEASDDVMDSAVSSIESQVLSTQISEINNISTFALSTQKQYLIKESTGLASKRSSTEKIKSATQSTRGQRPALHPLDLKTAAEVVATNVVAPQHIRKYSEGTSSVLSTTPISPKRSWFARLFDFKPQ
ncbi:hypothetical protein BGZ46_004637, partial [Entomortierella lignicola]